MAPIVIDFFCADDDEATNGTTRRRTGRRRMGSDGMARRWDGERMDDGGTTTGQRGGD